MKEPKITIAIPTYNRAFCLDKAVKAALHQNYSNYNVIVIDDGSQDDTIEKVKPFFQEPNFCYIKMGKNMGTAQAKNLAMMLGDYDAITFHDSDDIPHSNKLLMQARALCIDGHVADPILNWELVGIPMESRLKVDVVVGAHKMVKLDGSVHLINKRISLVDDFFPHLQFPSKTEGDWILINSGLFRKKVFEELGGYLDSVEEDRELRNRTIACGRLYYYLEEPLLTKIEMGVSLTVSDDTGYKAEKRLNDRKQVWERINLVRKETNISKLKKLLKAEVDLGDVSIKMISNPSLLTFNDAIPHTLKTEKRLKEAIMLYA
jgi:glycosyltransferase involved in cell wall biosynthesis